MNGMPTLELRDIHAAPPPDFCPPAPGWWVVALIAIIALVFCIRFFYRYYRRWRRRRMVFQALAKVRQTFETDASTTHLAAELSMLIRRVALARFPRNRVAGLQGTGWLAFLDETGGGGRFLEGPGRHLITAPYASDAELDVEGVYALVRDWVRRNA